MRRRIRVRVVYRKDRGKFCLRWKDRDGKAREEATDAGRRRDAQKLAGQKEIDLETEADFQTVPWHVVRDRYAAEVLSGKRPKTSDVWVSTTNSLARFHEPDYLQDITADYLSRYGSDLIGRGRAPATLGAYLRALRAALNWAAEIYPSYRPPKIRIPKNAQKMKGRPITAEEFERMLMSTEKVVGRKRAKSWRRFIRGLWSSGLRLGEALELSWDQPDKIRVVEVDSHRPKLSIPGDSEKGKRNRLLAMAPEFAVLLRGAPESRRSGPVFRLTLRNRVVDLVVASQTISAIGEAAAVRVRSRQKKDAKGNQVEAIKFASAHDLRRSFGTRWAGRGLSPTKLREIMRHSDISTTMQFYVSHDADELSDELWRASGDKSGDTRGQSRGSRERRKI